MERASATAIASAIGTPFPPNDKCECHAEGADGISDLAMLFDLQEVIDVLGLTEEELGSSVELRIPGVLVTGELTIADDCVQIVE